MFLDIFRKKRNRRATSEGKRSGSRRLAKSSANRSIFRQMRFERLEAREVFAGNGPDCSTLGAVLTGKLACVSLNVAEDVPADQSNPIVFRQDLTTVNPANPAQDTFRLEAYVQDLRTDDGDGNPNFQSFGTFAGYYDITYDDDAFSIPAGVSENLQGAPTLPFPISFKNARFRDDLVGGGLDQETFRYPNGPNGDLSTPGLINDVGSFMTGTAPPGKSDFFHFDVLFKVESIIGRNDKAFVEPGNSVDINVLGNDTLVSGQKTFTVGGPATLGGAESGTEFLVFGTTGFGVGGPNQNNPVVPADKIHFVNKTINVVNNGTLAVQSFTQGTKGAVTSVGSGATFRLRYTPSGNTTAPNTDSFTYVLTDGQGATQQVTVNVMIVPTGYIKDPLAHNRGIGGLDGATGQGYIMYSVESLGTRKVNPLSASSPVMINTGTTFSEHLVPVRFNEGVWEYDNNSAFVPFTPRPTDILLAGMNFSTDVLTDFKGMSGTEFGIQKGYMDGDIVITPNVFNNLANPDEYGVTGTFFVMNDPINGGTQAIGDLGRGVTTFEGDAATGNRLVGSGYLMFSAQDVLTRFAANPPTLNTVARNVIFVKFFEGQWFYDRNATYNADPNLQTRTYYPFQPTATDVILAEVDLEKLKPGPTLDLANAIKDYKGTIGLIQGIAAGYVSGDLAFLPNKFRNNGTTIVDNLGEIVVTGTQFVRNPTYLADREFLGEINRGMGVQDGPLPSKPDATGTGYVVYSEESLMTRLPPNSHGLLFAVSFPYNSLHLLPLKYINDRWTYDDNFTYREFIPRPSDVLLAELNFTTNTITSYKGMTGHVQGITKGFAYGSINFLANTFDSKPNTGEFTVNGGYFVRNQPDTSDRQLIGEIAAGVAAQDDQAGIAFVMFSEQNVFTRFAGNPPLNDNLFGSSKNLVVVKYNAGTSTWQYDTNSAFVNFNPVATDVLLATVDFGVGGDGLIASITDLKGTTGTENGIAKGYADGNLVFAPNKFRYNRTTFVDEANTGELVAKGSFFKRNP